MDIVTRVERSDPEDRRLEYKDARVDNWKIALELTALANTVGGVVVLGIQEDDDGEPAEIQTVSNPHQRREAVVDVIYERVEPNFEFDLSTEIINDERIAIFQVEEDETLHSYSHKTIDEPVFPVRRDSRIGYLHGHEVEKHYEQSFAQSSTKQSSDDLLRFSKNDLAGPKSHFIEAPNGHISDICIFSDVYYPDDPTRIVLSSGHIHNQEAEHIFAVMDQLFGLSGRESSFTINQSNGAWIGRGFENFIANLKSREERYQNVRDKSYDLDKYKHEQAVLISDFGIVYPESIAIIYVAPFLNHDAYRHFAINLIIDGQPTDVRPLIEFSERTSLSLSTSQKVSIPTDGIRNPSRIPVSTVERLTRDGQFGNDEIHSIDSAICKNPFYGRNDLLEQEIDSTGRDPLAKYTELLAFLRDWDDPDDPHEYESKRFLVTDWNEFTRGVYASVKEIRFDINW